MPRTAVRLLHPGHDDDRRGALLDENPDPTEEEIREAHLRANLPLHRLQEHREGRSSGPLSTRREQRGEGMTAVEEPDQRSR